ncbi:MAG: Kazal-type serine protease inhibitor domain-containing protein [Bacteroidota bacterium]
MKTIKMCFALLFFVSLFVACDCDDESLCEASQPTADCLCTEQYEPVCGCDGITYDNACFAACSGIPDWTPGECN